ncbi:hypothetical protein M427DRAFT_49923 [Gonapodya prolifera JEL478]|uniref:Uncharacterized protein n=1 Tax=Gonapodya prolifera (strain JEL478) TaxID=1344416 RepID=A0A138ZYG4_GONPJ|nr:hypothetical protein M427DRAFT_49923 [Gonapodya prolifera JEL478]|eukprot:KXS09153.1 hypothetical protein M427DRAFT_49923 [Gonapodya prolifera JEL478]
MADTVPNLLEFLLRESNIPSGHKTMHPNNRRPRAPPPSYTPLPRSEVHLHENEGDERELAAKELRLSAYYGLHEPGTVVSLSITGVSTAAVTALVGKNALEWGKLLMATPPRRAALIVAVFCALISYSTLRQAIGLVFTSFHHKKQMAVRLARLLDLSPSPEPPAQPIHRILVLPASRNLVANALILEMMRLGRNHDEVSVVVCDDALEMTEQEEMTCLELTRTEGADERMLEFVRVTPDGVGVPGWTTPDAGEDLGLGGALINTSRTTNGGMTAGSRVFSNAAQLDSDSGNLTDSSTSDSTISGAPHSYRSNTGSRPGLRAQQSNPFVSSTTSSSVSSPPHYPSYPSTTSQFNGASGVRSGGTPFSTSPSSTPLLLRLPFRDSSFDAVYCSFLPSLLHSPIFSATHSRLLRLRALRELARLVREGGALVIWDVEHVAEEYEPRLREMRYGDRERAIMAGELEGDGGLGWEYGPAGAPNWDGVARVPAADRGVGLKAVVRLPQRDGELMFERVWCTEGEVAFGGLYSRAVIAIKRS